MKPTNHKYGGQAVIEGVMIRGQHSVCTSVRNHDGNIVTRIKQINPSRVSRFRNTVFIRGIFTLVETIHMGMDSLSFSARVASGEDDEPAEKQSFIGMILVSLLIGIGVFFLIPLFASKPFEDIGDSYLISNIAEGTIRLAIFVAYVALIGLLPDIRRVYMYHGAEHMAVHAKENGRPLTSQEIRNFPTAHPRCGTAFLLTVMLTSIVIFSLLPRDPLWWLVTSRVVFIPVIAGISYEMIRFSSMHSQNVLVRALMAPNLWLQSLTTKIPDEDQIEVAISAMTGAIESDMRTQPRI